MTPAYMYMYQPPDAAPAIPFKGPMTWLLNSPRWQQGVRSTRTDMYLLVS